MSIESVVWQLLVEKPSIFIKDDFKTTNVIGMVLSKLNLQEQEWKEKHFVFKLLSFDSQFELGTHLKLLISQEEGGKNLPIIQMQCLLNKSESAAFKQTTQSMWLETLDIKLH